MDRRPKISVLCLLVAWLGLPGAALALPDFTFVHLSDVHFPYAADQTRATLAALPTTAPVQLVPYNAGASAPSFAIITGDLNEYGGGSGWWEGYLELWQAVPWPLYHQLGNHDNTWDCARPRLRGIHGRVFYAFEQFGAKFIGWDTATPQDPRPSVATEGLLWLQTELARTPAEQPVFFFCHHPLDGREFSGEYEKARLLDVLSTRNVVLLLVGHGHGVRHWQIAGFDTVMGGSTFGKRPGFGVVSVQQDVLRVCHQYVGAEMVGLLEKPLQQRAPSLRVASVSPRDGAVFRAGDPLLWSVRVEPSDAVQSGRWTLDADRSGDLVKRGDAWEAVLDRNAMEPGAHTLRFELLSTDGRSVSRTVAFWLDGGPFGIAWKQALGGSCQSTPAVAGGVVYVGANDGGLYAFDAATGRRLWRFMTGGEVRSDPTLDGAGQRIVFGSADGVLYAVGRDGELVWRYDVGSPIYASPLLAGEAVVCGANSGDIVALDAATGRPLWRSDAPEYTIETRTCAGNGAVFAGAWDRFVYALDLASGALRWRVPSRGSEREGGVARYYSPADCGPVFAEGNVLVADRAYYLTVLDANTGQRRMDEEHCAAVSASQDGSSVYVRHTDGRVSKRRSDGSVVWTANVPTGAIATPPVEAHGRVWVLSNLGTLSALDAATGEVLAQYKAFPDLYAFAAPAFDGERVYVADMAGDLLALTPTVTSPAPASAEVPNPASAK